ESPQASVGRRYRVSGDTFNRRSKMTGWEKQRSERNARLEAGSRYAAGKIVPPESAKVLLEAIIRPGDRVCLEGDNQKEAVFPAGALAGGAPPRIYALHIVKPGIVPQAHVDLLEGGIARKLDFFFSGPQGCDCACAGRRQSRVWRHPYIYRAVRPL